MHELEERKGGGRAGGSGGGKRWPDLPKRQSGERRGASDAPRPARQHQQASKQPDSPGGATVVMAMTWTVGFWPSRRELCLFDCSTVRLSDLSTHPPGCASKQRVARTCSRSFRLPHCLIASSTYMYLTSRCGSRGILVSFKRPCRTNAPFVTEN